MQHALTNLRVLVTQSTEFIGPALCEVFAEQGATVVARADALADPEAAERVVREAGHLDVLVANLAWRAPSTPALDVQEDEWRTVCAALVDPLPRLVRAAGPPGGRARRRLVRRVLVQRCGRLFRRAGVSGVWRVGGAVNGLQTLVARLTTFTLGAALACAAAAQPVPTDRAGFTDHVARLLRAEVGEQAVVVKGPLTLGLGELQANLDRVFAFCNNNAGRCADELDRYVKGAAEVHKERSTPPARDAVRVVLRTSQYVQAVQGSAGGGGTPTQIQPRPFADGLVALPVLDTPRTLRMLGSKDNERMGLSEQQVFDLGLQNLRSTLKPLMDVAKVAGPGQIGQLVGDTFHPSRLLLHDSWVPLAKAQGGVLIAAIPATDVVLYIGEDTPTAIDALRALANSVQARAPNRLSTSLLRWGDAGWTVLP